MVKHLVMGNEAFAHAALAAGVRVVAGYPGTPSSEVIETIAAEHKAGRAKGVHVEWSTNEKVALELLAGASIAGARCLFTCKQVGLNVASDALLSLNYVGIKGGLVLFVADDPGPISSQTEQDTRRFAGFAKVPVLDPSTVEQGYDMVKTAFDLSEAYHTPVIVRSSTRICHASAFMELPEQTQSLEPSGFERSSRWVIFPRRAFEAHKEINDRLLAIAADYTETDLSRFNYREDARACAESAGACAESASARTENDLPLVGIVAGGVSASYVREALSMLKERCAALQIELPAYRFIHVGTPYPFPEKTMEAFIEGLEAVLIFEELDHVLEDEMLKLCGILHASYEVYGRLTGHARDRGENTVDDIFERIAAFFGVADALEEASEPPGASEPRGAPEPLGDPGPPGASGPPDAFELQGAPEPPGASELSGIPELPLRPPILCAGCPHRGSFYAMKRALKQMKQEAVLCGDIGCYTLGNALPLDAVDTCLCMGAGISMAQGFAVVQHGRKQIAFVGDSTFFASGLPGIVNAVYNGHDITVAVLDNSITAMTGAQPHPGTGDTLMGDHRPGVSIEAVLKAVGFKHIGLANPFKLEESMQAAQKALQAKGPSAVIYKAPCITLVKPEAPVAIDRSCTGCKKCIKEIGCPAIGFDAADKKAIINASLCTGCGLCVQICPFKVIAKSDDQPGIDKVPETASGEGSKAGDGSA